MIIGRLNKQIGNLIFNGPALVTYHEKKDIAKDFASDDPGHDKSSIGTISSADEKDMELLFSGEHTY